MIKDGGWWFHPDGLNETSIVYSLGVGDEINFDLAIIDEYGVQVFAFDPTPNSVDMLDASKLPEKFHFHPWAVTAADGTLEFYPRLKKDGTKSDVMFTMIPEEETKERRHRGARLQPRHNHEQAWPRPHRLAENGYRGG